MVYVYCQLVNGLWSIGQWSMVYRVDYPVQLSKSLPNRSKVVYLTVKKEPCRLSGDSRQGGQDCLLHQP
jgi:hypothetical protein